MAKDQLGTMRKLRTIVRFSPIRDWFLNVPFNVLEEIALHPLSKQNICIFQEARRFITEMQTCLWLEKENLEKGRTVSSLQLVQYYFDQLKRNEHESW